jgi:adhesin HecA-like repeat protein
MLSDRLTRSFARVVLATYITQLFAPVVHASEKSDVVVLSPMSSLTKQEIKASMRSEVDKINRLSLKSKSLQPPLTSQQVKIPPSLKTEVTASLPLFEPHQQLPTLLIRLNRFSQEIKGESYRLSIERTNPVASGDSLKNFQWQKEFFFSSLKADEASSPLRTHTVNFSLMGSLNLIVSETGQLTAFSTIDSSGSYQAYNYHFHLCGNLHLANLMTNGQIDVKQAQVVSAEGEVYGEEGIFIKGKKEIRTRSKNPKHPTHLHSKKRITLNSPYLDNENSCIQAPLIEGTLGRKGQRGASLNNTKGFIEATDLLSLTLATEVFNEGGVLNASSGKTKISTFESFLNKKGFVGGKRGLDLTVEGRLQNPGGKLRSEETAKVKAGFWTHTTVLKLSQKTWRSPIPILRPMKPAALGQMISCIFIFPKANKP